MKFHPQSGSGVGQKTKNIQKEIQGLYKKDISVEVEVTATKLERLPYLSQQKLLGLSYSSHYFSRF